MGRAAMSVRTLYNILPSARTPNSRLNVETDSNDVTSSRFRFQSQELADDGVAPAVVFVV
jgi:hypothetical protein